MTTREKTILSMIKKDPMISQNALAKQLGITRSSVSVHISNLIKKGLIKGKGYVLSDDTDYVVVIGGANIDFTGIGYTSHENDSNPGSISWAYGGVGRNIAENLARLNIDVSLMTCLGDDFYGTKMFEHCQGLGINMSMTSVHGGSQTSMYMQMVDQEGNLERAVSDMFVMNQLTTQYIEAYENTLRHAKAIVAEGNLNEDVINLLVASYGEKLFFDPVSIEKAKKLKKLDLYCMTPNEKEAKVWGKGSVKSLSDLGVKFPVVTKGDQGLSYYHKKTIKQGTSPKTVETVTGAGDALMAGLVYGFMKDYKPAEIINYGLAMAESALASRKPVNPGITEDKLIKRVEELTC